MTDTETTGQLDNPIWAALTTGHRALAQGGLLAWRYPPDVAIDGLTRGIVTLCIGGGQGNSACCRGTAMNRHDIDSADPPTILSGEPNGFLYLDDLKSGQRFTSRTLEIEKERIISFASEFDPQPFHLSLVDGGLPIAGGLVGASVETQWPLPTRPGDQLRVDSEILDVTPSQSHSNRGTVLARGETRNQRSEIVQIATLRTTLHSSCAPRTRATGQLRLIGACSSRCAWGSATSRNQHSWCATISRSPT